MGVGDGVGAGVFHLAVRYTVLFGIVKVMLPVPASVVVGDTPDTCHRLSIAGVAPVTGGNGQGMVTVSPG